METHRDDDYPNFPLKALEEKAKEMVEKGESKITAGAPGEAPILEIDAGDFVIRRMPDDPLGVLRISVGRVGNSGAYLVFRGEPAKIRSLFESALYALNRAMFFRGKQA